MQRNDAGRVMGILNGELGIQKLGVEVHITVCMSTRVVHIGDAA
jgi:hypothetical protein